MRTAATKVNGIRPVVDVVTSEKTLEGGGFDERLSSLRSPCFARKPGQAIPGLPARRGGGPLDRRLLPPRPWRSPLRGALRASNFAPGEIVPSAGRARRARPLTGNRL